MSQRKYRTLIREYNCDQRNESSALLTETVKQRRHESYWHPLAFQLHCCLHKYPGKTTQYWLCMVPTDTPTRTSSGAAWDACIMCFCFERYSRWKCKNWMKDNSIFQKRCLCIGRFNCYTPYQKFGLDRYRVLELNPHIMHYRHEDETFFFGSSAGDKDVHIANNERIHDFILQSILSFESRTHRPLHEITLKLHS